MSAAVGHGMVRVEHSDINTPNSQVLHIFHSNVYIHLDYRITKDTTNKVKGGCQRRGFGKRVHRKWLRK